MYEVWKIWDLFGKKRDLFGNMRFILSSWDLWNYKGSIWKVSGINLENTNDLSWTIMEHYIMLHGFILVNYGWPILTQFFSQNKELLTKKWAKLSWQIHPNACLNYAILSVMFGKNSIYFYDWCQSQVACKKTEYLLEAGLA